MDPAAAEKLCAIREHVARRIGVSRYQTWFGAATELQLDGPQLDVTVANAFVSNWISSNYLPDLVEATRQVVGEESRVAVRVSRPPAGRDEQRRRANTADSPASALPVAPTPAVRTEARPMLRGELDSFVVGPSNELAFSVASSLVHNPATSFKHLVIYAGCGLGKTHLLQGICNGTSRFRPGCEWRYLSGEEFTNEFIYAVKASRVDAFRARFRSVDLLVIDDIHFLANKRATQDEFLHTFNAIDACGKTVVLTSDRHPRDIATLPEPLLNRMIAAMVVEIQPPDFATRREILRRRAAATNHQLPDDVLDFLAQRIFRNVRELEGAMYKLVAYASLTREPISLDLARRTLEDQAAAQAPEPAHIERLVAGHFGTSREAIHSASRDRTVTQARAVSMYLIRKHSRLSLPEIGRQLGNKQHSTVLMAVRRVQQLLDDRAALSWKDDGGTHDVPAREVIDQLESRLLRGQLQP